jgi:hypothetical protein
LFCAQFKSSIIYQKENPISITGSLRHRSIDELTGRGYFLLQKSVEKALEKNNEKAFSNTCNLAGEELELFDFIHL